MRAEEAILNPAEWRALEGDARLRYLDLLSARIKNNTGDSIAGNSASPKMVVNSWLNDGTLSPLRLYCYLKSRFGAPNGLFTLLRAPSTDNVIHWDYLLRAGDSFVNILGTNSGMQFYVHSQAQLQAHDWDTLVSRLQEETHRRRELKQVQRDLERWIVFVNPYWRISVAVERFSKQLRELDLSPPKALPVSMTSEPEARKVFDEHGRYSERVTTASTLGQSLRMFTPVLGEAFLNLVLFALAKPQFKQQDRLMENLLRAPIDVRTARLANDCDGFTHEIDTSSSAYKAFLRVMNARNSLLHGAVDPQRLKIEEVFFDYRTIPLFSQDRRMLEWRVSAELHGIERDDVLLDIGAVREFINYVLSCVDPRYRKYIVMLMDCPFPGWNAKERRSGVLFSGVAVEFIPGSAES